MRHVYKDELFRISGLVKEYLVGEVIVPALRGVDLSIKSGEFLVILGPSGSGKSTLLNIIGGLDTPTSGSVVFKNEDISAYSEKRLTYYRRNNIGFVFQFYNLIPNLTALENVEMATQISAEPMDAMDALQKVDISDRAGHFPSQLSGGEQQRVAMARALAKQPEILLCDEPTGALDISTGKVVLHQLREINRNIGTTVVVITHNMAVSKMADRVIVMRDGRVREIAENPNPVDVEEIEW
ncbi:ABC transporter ATP-binding protein [bacterium]|nr:ABC transporter ATP-binding protein [bacterium]